MGLDAFYEYFKNQNETPDGDDEVDIDFDQIPPENINNIYKNKGNVSEPSSYRPITLVSCLGKTFTAILNKIDLVSCQMK